VRRLATVLRASVAAIAALVATASSGEARADGLAAEEAARLLGGDTVSRTQTTMRGLHRYVGGVTYAIVDASPGDLDVVLGDFDAWRRFLPKTRDARRVGTADDDALVQITHGSALVQVGYTLRVHRDASGVRFWMDRGRPHDIKDVWGFFRTAALPDGRTLVSYGILIDMGDGILRDMFEPRVQQLALEVPEHVRDVVRSEQARGQRAAR
jgi:hypothetical protein